MTDQNAAYPPDYIKLPPSIACAGVDDALIVTMARILGLCWDQKYRRSPPYTPDQLAELVGRPRTTLYRHLNRLQELRWLRVDRHDRRLVLQPLVRFAEGQPLAVRSFEGAGHEFLEQEAGDNHELREALQEAGIVGRPCRELLRQKVDPVVVRAWHLWTWAPDQEWMDNPAGYVVNRLREGDMPSDEFLELAQLTADEIAVLTRAWAGCEQYRKWPSLKGNDKLQRLAPLWASIFDAMRDHRV
jgi:hypothetical protein